jgi:hypothetical protein
MGGKQISVCRSKNVVFRGACYVTAERDIGEILAVRVSNGIGQLRAVTRDCEGHERMLPF